jgi:hypothetical protein
MSTTRIVAATGHAREPLLHVSATAWVLAFAGFVIVYARLLAKRAGRLQQDEPLGSPRQRSGFFGISRTTLWEKMRRYGLASPDA